MAEKEKQAVDKWLQKISRAKEVREKWRETFRVAMAYEYFEGKQRPANVSADSWLTINLIYSNLLAMLPSLYAADPYFYIKLKRSYKPDPMSVALYEMKGKMRQSLLNYYKEELDLKTKTRLSIFDAMFQYGVFKIRHQSEILENKTAGDYITDEDGTILYNDDGEALQEPETIPVNEEYVLERIHPDDFLVDEDAGPLDEDVRWFAQRIKRPLVEAKEDTRFKKSVRKNLKATEVNDKIDKERELRKKGSGKVSATEKEDKKADIIVEWEIYDPKEKEWLVVAEGNDEFLIKPEEVPKGIEHHPFCTLRFTLRDDSWYPVPPVSQWLDPQRDYCDARSKISTQRKKSNRKYVVNETAFNDAQTEIDKLEVGEDGTIIRAQIPATDAVVSPIRELPTNQMAIQELALLRDELTLMSVGPNQSKSGRGVESATEAGIIEKRLQVQEGDWISLVIDFVRDIARKLDQLIQVHLTSEEAIKVVGPEGEYWQLVKPSHYEDIEGEYEYSVNVGATTPRLPEIERQQFIAWLTLLASAPQLATSKRLLKKTAEMHHIDDDQLIEELYQMAQKIMSGQMPLPGRQGSAAGSTTVPGGGITGAGAGTVNMA
jgi:hypothetical protein